MARVIDNKLLFIHVAKTGGTFVRESLNYLGIPNWETGLFEEHDHIGIQNIPEEFKSLKTFGVIRKPVDWLISRHKWALYTEFNEKIKVNTKARNHWMAKVWDDDPIKFLYNTIEHCPTIPQDYMFNMLGLDTPTPVEIIMKTETLVTDLSRLYYEELDMLTSDRLIAMPRHKEISQKITVPGNLREAIQFYNSDLIKIYNQI